MAEKTNMRPRSVTRLIREGEFVAEVTVQLIETEQGSGWAPTCPWTMPTDSTTFVRRCELVTSAGGPVGGSFVPPHPVEAA